MDPAYVSAFAALGGAGIGGATSFATSWMTNWAQTRAQRLVRKIERVEELYKNFVEEASRFYADSLVHETTDVSQLIRLYAMISRMRVLSSPKTVENAERIARMIVDTYLAPNKTFPELRDMVNRGAVDPLRDFSEACREELERFGYL
jgi:hypothetical protein